MNKKLKTKIDTGHYQFLGTDRFKDGERSFGKNYLTYRKKWRSWPQKKIVGDFPLHLDIETTNNCNLRCTMCGRNWMKEKLGYINFELFTKIIDEAAKYHLPSIKLNYRGEPLLHPDIVRMVAYAKEKGILEVQFNTNGLLLDEKKAKELIEVGLDRIIFSFDAAKKKTYEKIRRGSNYEKVINNIQTLINLRNKKGVKRPLTRIQMVRMSENKNEVEDFIRMWRPIINRIAVSTERNPLGTKRKIEHFPCPQIWQRLMICWNGEVRMCCGDWYGEIVLGNVKDTSVYGIWHEEKLEKIRKIHSKGDFNKIPLCDSCEVNTPRLNPELKKLSEKYESK